ncbi:unnamed protein product [Heterobilharzia americana]|nr:unnamed protein product [Heterobilharzia americana]
MTMYHRYIDDIFVILDQNVHTNEVLRKFIEVHPLRTFTCEEENASKLHFLDALLSRREDGSLSRCVYRKTTSISQYTHFISHVPIRYKANLVKSLSNRARKMCSDDQVLKELDYIVIH